MLLLLRTTRPSGLRDLHTTLFCTGLISELGTQVFAAKVNIATLRRKPALTVNYIIKTIHHPTSKSTMVSFDVWVDWFFWTNPIVASRRARGEKLRNIYSGLREW
jgi:hypothetical protein